MHATVSARVADLRTEPTSLPLIQGGHDRRLHTQLLLGETVQILEEKQGWYRVEALEQPIYSLEKGWHGYCGWIEKQDLVFFFRPPGRQLLFVTQTSTSLEYEKKEKEAISYGSLLWGRREEKRWEVLLPSEEKAWIADGDVIEQDRMCQLSSLFLQARQFLGFPYYWGGRSSFLPQFKERQTSVDCSGLIQLLFRSQGLYVPRDARDQHRKAHSVETLFPGCCLFTASSEKPEAINHVLLVTDSCSFIEATEYSNSVREISCEARFGVPLEGLQNAQEYNGTVLYFASLMHTSPKKNCPHS